MMAKKPRRTKNKDNARAVKKKISVLVQERVEYVDYKDVNLLRRFMSDRAKIRARRVTGNDAQQQREVAMAIKNAREMALLPYTQPRHRRSARSRDRGRRRRPGATVAAARPHGPPPSVTATAGADDASTPSIDAASAPTVDEAATTSSPRQRGRA